MANFYVSAKSSNEAIGNKAITSVSQALTGRADFRTLLGSLFNKTYDFLGDVADPDTKEITLEGLGTYKDKNAPGFQMVSAVYMNNIETQLNTSLNYLEFIYKTLPQAIERAIG